ncbi:TasA family protein [Bacillus sp. SCS-153A]|uniref:TasA family protein n=1 Tax=Rossellomorea sedimentorum TaxID=3115294 RepID=UPI003905BDA0
MGLKKRLGAAALATGIGAAAIGGGTFALFGAQASNTGNTFTAGTVSVEDLTGNGNVFSSSSIVANLAPGDAETGTITVKNNGNLEAWVAIDSVLGNGNTVHNDGTGDLFDGPTPVTLNFDSTAVKLAPGAQTTFNVSYSFPLGANNEYQGADGEVKVNVKAVQARNNTNLAGDGPSAW